MGENPYQSPLDTAVAIADRSDLRVPKTLFRLLVIGEIVLGILTIIVHTLTESTLPPPLLEYVESQPSGSITGLDIFLFAAAAGILIMLVVSSVGLLVFWRPSRLLYLLTLVVALLIAPLLGPEVNTGWEAPFDEAASVVSGAILALAYFSPIKVLFEKPANPSL